MGKPANSWIYEFVGPRYGLSMVALLAGTGGDISALVSHEPIPRGLVYWLFFSAAALIDVVVRALRPNRLRLYSEGFELTRTWGGRYWVAWRDAEPPFFVTFIGKGGRKYDVVRCEYMSKRRGRRTISMPPGLGVSTLSLLDHINEARAVARGDAHRTPPVEAALLD